MNERGPRYESARNQYKRQSAFPALLAGIAVGIGGVVGYDVVEGHNIWERTVADNPSVTPETSAPTIDTTPTHTPSKSIIPTPKPSPISPTATHHVTVPTGRFVPHENADGTVSGQTARYRGYTPEQVTAMENCGNDTDRVLLTIDDQGSPAHVRAIAAELKQEKIGAIFFPIAKDFSPQLIDELRDDGFWVGNHSYSHKLVASRVHPMTKAEITREITRGVDVDLYRPPGGATYKEKDGYIYFDSKVGSIAHDLGKRVCLWGVDTQDWNGRTAQQITHTVKTEVKPGSTVLIHMNDKYKTLSALPSMIKAVRDKGLDFCALPSEPTTNKIPESLPCN